MKLHTLLSRFFLSAAVLLLAGGTSGFAQDGKLVLHVTPKQAYIFVDGRAISEASEHHSLSLSPGDHKIELANYGYTPSTQTVTITAGKNTPLDVTLTPVSGTVSGPFGAISIGGPPRDAVLLNGKTPDYLLGMSTSLITTGSGSRNSSFHPALIRLLFYPVIRSVVRFGRGTRESARRNRRPEGRAQNGSLVPRRETEFHSALHRWHGQCDRRSREAHRAVIGNCGAGELRRCFTNQLDLNGRTSRRNHSGWAGGKFWSGIR